MKLVLNKILNVIGLVRCINILKWLRDFQEKKINKLIICPLSSKRDLDTKKTLPKLVCPEVLVAMLELINKTYLTY